MLHFGFHTFQCIIKIFLCAAILLLQHGVEARTRALAAAVNDVMQFLAGGKAETCGVLVYCQLIQ
jgi:hypothetical protein